MENSYLTDEDLDGLIPYIKNWDKWGSKDQLGTLNYITVQSVKHASSLVNSGKVVSLARETSIETINEDENAKYEEYKMHNQPGYTVDFVGMMFHGYKFTHLDGLCHIFSQENTLYNGYSTEEISEKGTINLGIQHLAKKGIVGRGVLIDIANLRGKSLEPGEIIRLSEIEEAIQNQNVLLQDGDILLVRSGTGVRNIMGSLSGVHPEIIPWLHDNKISIFGFDGGSDCSPNSYSRYRMPLHSLVIPYMGMPLLDNAELDELSQVCIEEERWEFMLTIAPWRLIGVSGSLVNPLAIF